MPSRLSLLFQFSTTPTDTAVSRVHTAGWSESYWAINPIASNDPDINALAVARAKLLPESASIIGFRIADYTIAQNKLKPTGTVTGKLNVPGNSGLTCDIPQIGLSVGAKSNQGPNISRFVLRGMPDDVMKGGEYAPTAAFTRNLRAYFTTVINQSWKFIGRDLTLPVGVVVGIAGNVLTTNVDLGVTANVSYIRLLHVKNSVGEPIAGAYLCTAANGLNYTLAGYAGGNITTPSGKARRDIITTFTIDGFDIGRAVSRKVGRPFESYRGRASKRR